MNPAARFSDCFCLDFFFLLDEVFLTEDGNITCFSLRQNELRTKESNNNYHTKLTCVFPVDDNIQNVVKVV